MFQTINSPFSKYNFIIVLFCFHFIYIYFYLPSIYVLFIFMNYFPLRIVLLFIIISHRRSFKSFVCRLSSLDSVFMMIVYFSTEIVFNFLLKVKCIEIALRRCLKVLLELNKKNITLKIYLNYF